MKKVLFSILLVLIIWIGLLSSGTTLGMFIGYYMGVAIGYIAYFAVIGWCVHCLITAIAKLTTQEIKKHN